MAGLKEVAKEAGFGSNTGDIVDIFDAVLKVAKAEGKVIIKGFGTFSSVVKPAYTGRNPATGEDVAVPSKRVLKFKASKDTVEVLEEKKKAKKKKK